MPNKSLSTAMPGRHRTPLTKTMSWKLSPQVVPDGKSRMKTTMSSKTTAIIRLSFRPYNAHGKQHLSNFLATLKLLAFLAHTALDWLDEAYRAVRNSTPSRRTFFENLRTLLQVIPFDNWQHLMQFMLHGRIELPVET